jgi:large subunit ribosomal protein L18
MKMSRAESRHRRHQRVRQRVKGTPERPRLCIRRTLRHLYAVVVDDTRAKGCFVLTAATTNTKAMKADGKSFANRESARLLGSAIAEAAKAKGVQKVVFDRGGYQYHGIIKEFAETVRKAGLEF